MPNYFARRLAMSPPLWLAITLDALGLAIFVVAGRQSHEIGGGMSWFLTVYWPFAVGWFFGAAATRVYVQPQWRRLLLCWLGGSGLALVLRALVTGRPTPVSFILVAMAFIAAINFGWRIVWAAARTRLGSNA